VELLLDPQAWIAFVTLTALELVLGIDNIVFISILVDRLPAKQRELARRIGLFLAMFMRIALLLTIAWIIGLTAPIFTVLGNEISGRDLILLAGGVFLIWKATVEIHEMYEDHATPRDPSTRAVRATFGAILGQIIVIDLVFSLDSIITAVGMVEDVRVMIAAVVAGPIGRFVSRHPTVKMLALAFLIMIGMALVADGLDFHVPKGYIYFAMAFSVAVEMLNLRLRRRPPA
jgi:predicted tellurium resistance membrane protein TerC